MCSMICRQTIAWWAPKWPTSASSSRGILARIAVLACWASSFGSRSPAISASIIAREETLQTPEATEVSLIPASCTPFQPLDLLCAGVDLGLAVAGQLAQLPDRRRRDETRPHHPVRRHVGQPLGVGEIALASRHVLDVLGVAQPD